MLWKVKVDCWRGDQQSPKVRTFVLEAPDAGAALCEGARHAEVTAQFGVPWRAFGARIAVTTALPLEIGND